MIGESSSRTDVGKENLVSLYLSKNWNILSQFDWYDRSFGVGVEFALPLFRHRGAMLDIFMCGFLFLFF
jgi:hypothetical protein